MASFNTTTSISVANSQEFNKLKKIITPEKDKFRRGAGKEEIERVKKVFSDLPFILK